MLLRVPARTIPGGTVVPDDTEASVYLHASDQFYATVQADAGWFTLLVNGNPGPHYLVLTYAGETHISSSKATGMSGPTQMGLLPDLFRVWTDGYIDGMFNELAVSAAGLGMEVTVASGFGIARGIIYDQYGPINLPIQPADTQPRYDRVVLEVVPAMAGEDIEGRASIVVKTGVAATNPVVPSLTQTTALWQIPLATVTVNSNVTVIASNKVADERTISGIELQDGSVTTPKLAALAVDESKLANLSVSTGKIQNFAINEQKILNLSVSEGKIAPNAVTVGKMSSDAVRSTAAIVQVLRAAAASENPEWGPIATSQLSNWSETAPATGQVAQWNGTAWTPATLAEGGGGAAYGGRQSQFQDANFGAIGWLSGVQNLGTATVQLDAGSWLIETQLHFTARGTGGDGTFTARLTGSATPQGGEASARIFQTVNADPRMVVLTGRRVVTSPAASTAYSATAQVEHTSGSFSDIRDGVVYIVATPR